MEVSAHPTPNEALHPQQCWRTPTDRNVKINVDASFKDGCASLSLICRDVEGQVLAAATKVHDPCRDMLITEAEALRWDFQMAIDLCFHNIEVESDNLLLI